MGIFDRFTRGVKKTSDEIINKEDFFKKSLLNLKPIIRIVFDEDHLEKTLFELEESFLSFGEKFSEDENNVNKEIEKFISEISSGKLKFEEEERIFKLGISKNYHIRNAEVFLNHYAYLLFDKKRFLEGLDILLKGILMMPMQFYRHKSANAPERVLKIIENRYSAYLDSFGYGLFLIESYEFSIVFFSEAINCSPNHEDITEFFTNRGISKLKIGLKHLAKLDFEEALKIDKNYETAQNLLSKMNSN